MNDELTPERAAELQTTIGAMGIAASAFYSMAVRIGNHPFIEFAGLMNEYIECCRDALKRGQDFSLSSAHTGQELPVAPYRLAYLNEKLNCIFGGRIEMKGRQ